MPETRRPMSERKVPMLSNSRDVALVCAAVVLSVSGAAAAPPSPPGNRGGGPAPARSGPPPQPGSTPPAMPQPTTYPQPPSTVSADAAARARMHECGHQWSSMKRAGTTGLMTWKEFSSTCLVVR